MILALVSHADPSTGNEKTRKKCLSTILSIISYILFDCRVKIFDDKEYLKKVKVIIIIYNNIIYNIYIII